MSAKDAYTICRTADICCELGCPIGGINLGEPELTPMKATNRETISSACYLDDTNTATEI